MGEKPTNNEYLPFDDPAVRAVLLEGATALVVAGIAKKFDAAMMEYIQADREIQHVHGLDNDATVGILQTALGAGTYFSVHSSVAIHQEEELFLVKVDYSGQIIPGAVVSVAVFGADRAEPHEIESGFNLSDATVVLAMLENQEALPWKPMFDSIF